MVGLQLALDPAAVKCAGVFLGKADGLFLGKPFGHRLELQVQLGLQRGDGGVVTLGKIRHAGGLLQLRVRRGILAVHRL